MIAKKEDWNFEEMNIFQNKIGKNKGLPKESPVCRVKNLQSYVVKMAKSESASLDLAKNKLPVCFDAKIFTFASGQGRRG